MSKSGSKNRGWTVTVAGIGINLALGILYAKLPRSVQPIFW